MHILRILLLITAIATFHMANARIVEQLGLFRQKEDVGGIMFEYRQERMNGKVSQDWRVNSEPVDLEIYEKRYLEAVEQELAQERALLQEEQKRQYKLSSDARLAVLKKLLSQSYDNVSRLVKKLEDPHFESFMVWDPKTIASQKDFIHLNKVALPKIQELQKRDSVSDICRYEGLIKRLDELQKRLDILYAQTLNQAISKSDDSRVLKKLLELV